MTGKITLRQAALVTVALTVGSTGGTLTEAIYTHLGHTQPGAGQVATAIITLWIYDKLDTLIDDSK
jgi:hypothetical protein